jgi:hypothetical protein
MKYTEEEVSQAMEGLPALWVLKHNIKNESGLPIEFKHHKFMWDLYNDMSPLQVWLKPPQIGATVAQIIKSFYVAKKLGKDIIYTLPTASDVNDMAGGKINRLVAQNPILNGWVKDHDTVEQKSVGDNIIHYRGSFTTKSAMMVSSSLNIHDELDASDQRVIEQYETRLQAQAGGWRWYFSHPSVTDYGVDKYWQISDQKHWFIDCPHCKKKQFLSFPENIDKVKRVFICKHCQGELSDEDRENGRWVAKYSKKWQEENGIKPFSGYWISQLMCSWITADKILDDFANKPADYFSNYVLGLPFSGGDSKLTQKHLFQNLTGENTAAEDKERIVIGIDTGNKIDYVLGNQRLGLFFQGDTDNYNTLDTIMRRYPRAIAIIDAGGDYIGAQQFAEKWSGRVFKCYTNTTIQGDSFVKWGEGEKYGEVFADRNRAIQQVVDEFRTKKIPLQGTESDWLEYWMDWSNLSRIKIFDPKTNQLRGTKWVRNGRDHKALATMLWRIGVDKFTDIQAQIVYPKGDNEFASHGYVG